MTRKSIKVAPEVLKKLVWLKLELKENTSHSTFLNDCLDYIIEGEKLLYPKKQVDNSIQNQKQRTDIGTNEI